MFKQRLTKTFNNNKNKIAAISLTLLLLLLMPATSVQAFNYTLDNASPYTGDALVVSNVTEAGLFDSETSITTISSSSNTRQVTPPASNEESIPTETIIGYDEYGNGLLDPNAFIPDVPITGEENSTVDGSLDYLPDGVVADYTIGDEKSLVVLLTHNSSTMTSVKFEVIHVGTHCTVWTPAGSSYGPISVTQAAEIATEFDDKYSDMVTAFADPMSDSYKRSDLDNDGKVALICYDIHNIGKTGNSYVAGYFNPADLYYGNSLSTNPGGKNGNYMDALYIDTVEGMLNGNVEQAFGTIIHEFQHLIYRLTLGDNVTNPTFFNEGLSMAAEMMIYEGTEHAPTDRISYYNRYNYNMYKHSLTDWQGSLENYSLSFLFMQYLRTQYKDPTSTDPNERDGTALFKDILNYGIAMNSNVINSHNKFFEEIIRLCFPDTDASTLINNFYTAVAIKDASGDYGFDGESWSYDIDPYFYNTTSSITLIPGATVYYGEHTNFTPFSSNSSANIQLKSYTILPSTITGEIATYNSQLDIDLTLYYVNSYGMREFVYSKALKSSPGDGYTVTEFEILAMPGVYSIDIEKDGHVGVTLSIIYLNDDLDLTLSSNPQLSTIKLTPGDVDGNGTVNTADLLAIAGTGNYNKSVTEAVDKHADYNGDGRINFLDLAIMRKVPYFGQ